MHTDWLSCRFGTVGDVAATYQTAQLVTCVSPAAGAAAAVALEVSNNAQDFSGSGVIFTYHSTETVTSLSVTHGPERTYILTSFLIVPFVRVCFLFCGLT